MKRAIGRENMVNSGTELGEVQNPEGSDGLLRLFAAWVPWWEEGQTELRRLICSLSLEFFSNNLHAQYTEGGSEWEKQTKLWQRNWVIEDCF